jgi:hypothetical protein
MSRAIRNGDVILVDRKTQGWISWSVTFGAKLRYGFFDPDTQYSHAAIVYDAEEPVTIVEATALNGVQLVYLSKYRESEYVVAPTDVTPQDFYEVRKYLDSVLNERATYDFSTIAGLSLYAVTGSKLCIQRAGSVTCSGLVCEALTRAGFVWKRPPYACTPADISAQLQPGKASWLDADTRREARLASRA